MKKSILHISFGLIAILLLLILAPACRSTAKVKAEREVGKIHVKKTTIPATTMAELLRRKPNVNVTGSGQNLKVSIRGRKTFISDSRPMYIVNGIRVGNNYENIAHLNPGDVDRIEIITDPATLASYGSGAMEGVIEIYLKK